MSDLNLHKQRSQTLDDCLVKISQIIQALGVEEMTVSPDAHQHVINTGMIVDKQTMDGFVSQIDEMYSSIVAPVRNLGPGL